MIIWAHGFTVEDEILDMADDFGFEIRGCFRRRVSSMRRTIASVYSDDYAPLHHLRSKTSYLKNLPAELLLVPMTNWKPELHLVGDGRFRHVESRRVRELKEAIRDRFNPRKMRSRSAP